MLEQYIKKFAHEYLELKKEYLDYIRTDDGVYSLEINDTLICTLEETSSDDTCRFAFTIALGREERADDLVKKIALWSSKLRITTWNGLARIVVSPSDLTAGLFTCFICSSSDDDQERFNRYLHSFMICALYLHSGERKALESIPGLVVFEDKSSYINLLNSLGLDEDKLVEQFNRIYLGEDFSSVIEYISSSNHLILQNSFEFRDSADFLLSFLEQNSALPLEIFFTYEKNVVFLLQCLDLKKTDSDAVIQALARQQAICSELSTVLDAEGRKGSLNKAMSVSDSQNYMFI